MSAHMAYIKHAGIVNVATLTFIGQVIIYIAGEDPKDGIHDVYDLDAPPSTLADIMNKYCDPLYSEVPIKGRRIKIVNWLAGNISLIYDVSSDKWYHLQIEGKEKEFKANPLYYLVTKISQPLQRYSF